MCTSVFLTFIIRVISLLSLLVGSSLRYVGITHPTDKRLCGATVF